MINTLKIRGQAISLLTVLALIFSVSTASAQSSAKEEKKGFFKKAKTAAEQSSEGSAIENTMEAMPMETAAAPALPEEPVIPQSLYERLGGENAIRAVVDSFVALAVANPKVNFTRKGTAAEWEASESNVATLKNRLFEFIAVATGAQNVVYQGRDMKTVHQGMGISVEEFSALADDLRMAMNNLKLPTKEQDEVMAIMVSTQNMVVAPPAPAVPAAAMPAAKTTAPKKK